MPLIVTCRVWNHEFKNTWNNAFCRNHENCYLGIKVLSHDCLWQVPYLHRGSIQQLYIYFLANDTFHISTGAPFYRCTFEDDDNSCFLREDINDDFNWTRNKVNEYFFYHRWIKWKGAGAKSSTGKTYFNTLFPISSLSFFILSCFVIFSLNYALVSFDFSNCFEIRFFSKK